MPLRKEAVPWTDADIALLATITPAAVALARVAWQHDTKRDAARLLDAIWEGP